MRLIDADKVIQSVDMQIIIVRELLDNDTQVQEFVSIAEQGIKQEISNAPTVNAIPIEWLERKGMILAANKYDFSAGVIRIVIKEWEKENDKNI